MAITKKTLVQAGVKLIQENYGFPSCDEDSIFTNPFFRIIFTTLIKRSRESTGGEIGKILDELLHECNDVLQGSNINPANPLRLFPKDKRTN